MSEPKIKKRKPLNELSTKTMRNYTDELLTSSTLLHQKMEMLALKIKCL